MDELRSRLSNYPTVSLMERPTPLQTLAHAGLELGIDLWLKRDDLTSLGLGGDKPRKLEYELARAMAEGADVIVTCGAAQSNHARLTTAAARRLGLDAVVVLSGDDHAELQGKLLTVHLMGARVVVADTEDHWGLDEDVAAAMADLRDEGRTPYFVPISGTTPHSCLGYVDGALEFIEQANRQGLEPDVVVLPFGTGGIYSAYLLTLRALGIPTRVLGISVNRPEAECAANLDHWWNALVVLLDLPADLDQGAYEIDDGFVGRAYGDATEACLDAIVDLATWEGVILDPVYSGKTFAGLQGHVVSGSIAPGATVAMLHSGGVPANFAYHEEIAEHLDKRQKHQDPGGRALE
jgi:1-aminocyclopropane-1-carboxylate deaminase/D-cysteine desulfhydrase-like pyridoxal-dependent ACC family enzyme